MQIEITFLGTGTSQGQPIVACPCDVCASTDPLDTRLRSSVMLSVGGRNIVIDTGPDFRYQMLREHVRCLDAVLFTHEHKDHTGGLDDIRAFNYVQQGPIDVYAEQKVQQVLRSDYYYAFTEPKYPGVPDINLVTIDDRPFSMFGIDVVPIRGHHAGLPVLGFRIGRFCYITDFKTIDDSELAKLQGLDVLVVNAVRPDVHFSHFSLPDAIGLIAKTRPDRAFITHISHKLGFHRDMCNSLPVGVKPAYDGLKLMVDL